MDAEYIPVPIVIGFHVSFCIPQSIWKESTKVDLVDIDCQFNTLRVLLGTVGSSVSLIFYLGYRICCRTFTAYIFYQMDQTGT